MYLSCFSKNVVLLFFQRMRNNFCWLISVSEYQICSHIIISKIKFMSNYDSSESQAVDYNNDNYFQKSPFQYDYFLSNSTDVFGSWAKSVLSSRIDPNSSTMEYLRLQFPFVCKIDKFRTANIIRSNGFIFKLKEAITKIKDQFIKLYSPAANSPNKTNEQLIQIQFQTSQQLQTDLTVLLRYLQAVIDQGMQNFFKVQNNNFEQTLFEIVNQIYSYVTNPKLLWDLLGCETQLIESASNHVISLGGNQPYYKNVMRSIFKKSIKLKQIYDKFQNQLQQQTIENMQNSRFLNKVISSVYSLSKEDVPQQKDKKQFIDTVKGVYFLHLKLRESSIFYKYLFTSFHLEHLQIHRMFKDFQHLESLYIELLTNAKSDSSLLELVYTLEIDQLPFDKRKRVPQIQSQTLDIVLNYIGTAKKLLDDSTAFPQINIQNIYNSSRQLLNHQSMNGLVGLLMQIQNISKDAFSLGGIQVHKIYLKMSQIIKKIYLSYEHDNWIFPTDILLYIPLRYFIQISEDIKADVKKTLFQMVNVLNEDRMPHKLIIDEGNIVKTKVDRGEYLQVILFFLEACRREEEYINLPEIIPKNMETSILYVKSLESKLNVKEPNQDQKPYFQTMLAVCENYKLTINFKWYDTKESLQDRQQQFNIEKELPQEWMRRIYRETIHERQAEKLQNYFQKYSQNKGLSLLGLANILKYNHGLNLQDGIPEKKIKEQDLFVLLDQIRTILSIYFDIFALNMDQEISLNYIHVCLSLYNSTIQQAPGNQIYTLIMDKIMQSYIRHPNSSVTKFRNKYPAFFNPWIYSFQIGQLFEELGNFISNNAEDQQLAEDCIDKIKMIGDFIQNKQNIEKSTSLEQLTEIIIMFSTLLNPKINPAVYLQGVELYCLFLNTFPATKAFASLDFLFGVEVLSEAKFIDSTLIHLRANDNVEGSISDVSIFKGILLKLPEYSNQIGLKKSFEVISTYRELRKSEDDANFNSLTELILGIPMDKLTFLQALLKFIFVLKKLSDEQNDNPESQQQKQKQKTLEVNSLQILRQLQIKFKQFEHRKQECAGVINASLADFIFLQQIQAQLDLKQSFKNPQINLISRSIMKGLVLLYGQNDDLMYFAEKLNMTDLILPSNSNQMTPTQQSLLVDLIVENKHKQVQTQLIKRLLRQNKKLSVVAEQAISKLAPQRQKVHSYHINRFIQINSRYPNQKIQKFIIDHLECQRNNSAAKINQRYLITQIIKKLDRIPKQLCNDLLLRSIGNEKREGLVQSINDVFQKLLYLPIKKFDKIGLKVLDEHPEEDQDWENQSEGQKQTKPERGNQKDAKTSKKDNGKYKQDIDYQDEVDQQMQSNNTEEQIEDQNNEDDEDDYRQFLAIFTDHQKRDQLHLYEKVMLLREELDVLIDSDYDKLIPGSKLLTENDVVESLLGIAKIMNQIQSQFRVQICYKMPSKLFYVLKNYGLQAKISAEMLQKLKKRREPTKKSPKWMFQYFSDRSESDDSNIVQDHDSEEGNTISDYNSDDENNCYAEDSEDDEEDVQVYNKKKNNKKVNHSKKKNKQGSLEEPPELLPTYSKIQQQISGNELKRQQILKILQIALYSLLNLPQSQIRTRHVTSFYMDILQSNFGQMFIESLMAVIRFDETEQNLQKYLKQLRHIHNSDVDIGLQYVSMEDAINNILYLIKEYEQTNVDKENYGGNMLFKESGTLLPIAEEMILKFNLPLQNNCLTLLLIFIQTNKAKIRRKISELNYTLEGHELGDNIQQYKLKPAQVTRIISSICKHGSSNKIWQTILQKMNLKISNKVKLFACINGYGSHLNKKVQQTGDKIMQTIRNIEGNLHIHYSEHQKLHNMQNSYHVISKLIYSCKQEIKQFYFINKRNLRDIMDHQSYQNEEIVQIKQIPKLLLKYKEQILKNKELIQMCQTMFYFIKILRDQFYGKVQDKMFAKLIHYPKMVIQASWFYVFLFAKHSQYHWTSPSQIAHFFSQYPRVGNYQFKTVQQVFNLVVYFLGLQSFCTDKFKQFLMPVLMKNHSLARQIPLRFKMPKIDDDDITTQNILVTRKCSFDMAFFQVVGKAITVQFHQEEGSDHGGLVRELMIGWKGKGVGEQDFFIGKILGISFRQGVPYGGCLDIGMFVAMTNSEPDIQFFKEVEPQIYKSLIFIRDNDVTDLCLKFSVQKIINGKLKEFDLIEGGRNTDVTEFNKTKYLEEYTRKYYFLGRERELKELRDGFNTVVFPDYAQIFTPFEMLKQIRGQQIVDVKMLISKAKYQGFSQQSQVIKWFWSIVEGFDQQRMNTFIQFVTGSPKITVYNSNFSITIEKVFDVNCLPVAHTCFNTLDLPEYSTKEILYKKLITAISEGNNSFGIM